MLDAPPVRFVEGAPAASPVSRGMVDVAAVFGGALLLALCAQVRIPLPFTPVPITGQTFAVLLLPVMLGGWRGPAAVAAYLAQGALGLPFFAGGAAGAAVLAGPTGGYLLGFLLAAVVIAVLAGHSRGSRVRLALAMVAGNLVIYLCGVPWLARFVEGGLGAAVMLGMTPFLVGDAIKLIAALILVPADGRTERRAER